MAPDFSLSPEQAAEFERAGMLHIPNFFPRRTMADMAARIWANLSARFGIDRARRETWTKERPAQFQALIESGAFDGLAPGLHTIADAFLGEDAWEPPSHICLPLVTFPSGGWDVPHTMWHIDQPPEDTIARPQIVRVFVLLEQVGAKGGGTCYVEGSHRVIADRAAALRQRLRSAEVKDVLKQDAWFAALFSAQAGNRESRFMSDGGLAWSVPVRVKETVGEPGDVYVMHPAMLHTAAPNGLNVPRMMLGQSLVSRGMPEM
ncbi:MAG TPA: phytanoyl-CoA dioxygenase family protein [Rhizomicrobium sp.]|nr:phytanoyl-CoA dioxygenase family protein [Rhizomicrobium sp.]